MKFSLGLYLNSNNPDPSWLNLDKQLFLNVRDIAALGSSAAGDVLKTLVRWGRRSEDHTWVGAGCPYPLGCLGKLWVGTREFKVGDSVTGGINADLGRPVNGSMLSKSSVADFARQLAAERGVPILVLGGHGDGPYATLAFVDIEGAVPSVDTSPSWLAPSELTEGLLSAGFGNTRKLQIIGFDACQQAGIELAVELQPYAEILVASELNIPGAGWPYDVWPKKLFDASTINEAATGIVESYRAAYENTMVPVCLSILRLSQIDKVAACLNDLSKHILSTSGDVDRRAFLSVRRTMPEMPYSRARKVDALELFRRGSVAAEHSNVMKQLCRLLLQSLIDAVDGNSWASEAAERDYTASGLTIAFPKSTDEITEEFREVYFDHDATLARFKESTCWNHALHALLASS